MTKLWYLDNVLAFTRNSLEYGTICERLSRAAVAFESTVETGVPDLRNYGKEARQFVTRE